MKIQFMGRDWRWNQEDVKLIQVNDWIRDLYVALQQVTDPWESTAIQAGGAMGVWPWVMAQHMDTVHTFEPNPGNFACLDENLRACWNAITFPAALGDEDGFVEVKLPPSEQNNAGAYYVRKVTGIEASTNVPVFRIDTLRDDGDISGRVGLIQLDVEGYELRALKGAINTITTDWPVIMVEDKPLPQDKETGHVPGAVGRWLAGVGYKLHKKVHRDLIFVPGAA